MSADTINHIFGIDCTMSADTNNVSGIREVTPPTQNSNHGEILVCAVRLPKFPALYTAASLDAAPSMPPPSVPLPPPLTPRCRANPVVDPAFSLDVADSAPFIIPDPVAPSSTPSCQPRCRPRLRPRRRRQCPRHHPRPPSPPPRPRCTIPDPVAPTPLQTPPSALIAPSLTSKVSSLSSSPLTTGEARPTQAP
jgi:hypothetical protein